MTSFIGNGTGRVLLLHMTKGDDILKCVEQGVKDAGIQSGVVVSGIGTVSKFRYHYIKDTDDNPTDVFETVEGPLEIPCIQGAILEGKPHLHVVASEHGDKTWSGHLEEGCVVLYLAEIVIMEMEGMPLGREKRGPIAHVVSRE